MSIPSTSRLSAEFYFVRHGETDWTKNDILQGPKNLSLNQNGKKQAKAAALVLKKNLANLNNAILISSALQRANETAQIISSITKLAFTRQDENLNERYYGDYRLTSDLAEQPSDAESDENFKKRVEAVCKKIIKESSINTHVIISHQKVFEQVCKILTGSKQKLDLGGIAHFTNKDGKPWKIQILR